MPLTRFLGRPCDALDEVRLIDNDLAAYIPWLAATQGIIVVMILLCCLSFLEYNVRMETADYATTIS